MQSSTTCYSSIDTHIKEHKLVLQMCCRIRKGLQRKVEIERIRSYANWFRENYLEPHFKEEEQYIFPILGNNPRVKKALANHRRIKRLLNCSCENIKVLNLLEEELATYVKFEEKTLYREFLAVAGEKELEALHHKQEVEFPEWNDQFWL